ncbi:hypothetical protein FGO68_gene13252 [Halteria grandinella]|uniref:Uncharacterized protein n=1 Tax=Halteria grandinella TaxID=5974 RepID=A0A8J8NZG3_HALGN|nr:hypothetical protein FGO68_gene13252 [Halteria grandinella]
MDELEKKQAKQLLEAVHNIASQRGLADNRAPNHKAVLGRLPNRGGLSDNSQSPIPMHSEGNSFLRDLADSNEVTANLINQSLSDRKQQPSFITVKAKPKYRRRGKENKVAKKQVMLGDVLRDQVYENLFCREQVLVGGLGSKQRADPRDSKQSAARQQLTPAFRDPDEIHPEHYPQHHYQHTSIIISHPPFEGGDFFPHNTPTQEIPKSEFNDDEDEDENDSNFLRMRFRLFDNSSGSSSKQHPFHITPHPLQQDDFFGAGAAQFVKLEDSPPYYFMYDSQLMGQDFRHQM